MPALTLEGPKLKRALFGFAMAVAGDLNRDGYPGNGRESPRVMMLLIIQKQ